MGYNALLAGLILMPGGIGMLLSMAVVGKLVEKINPKVILCTGICVAAYSMYMLVRINLFIDYETIAITRVFMGIGLGMLLVPLLSMSFSSIANEDIGNATGVFTTLRTISLSFGTAFVVTLFSRRCQFHQSRLSEVLNPFDPRFQLAVQKIVPIVRLKTGGASDLTVHGVIYQQLMKEAALASFVDTFFVSAIIVACALPLVFFLKRPKEAGSPLMIH
jgi:DHA2 family multidrug resistance protein